MSRMLVVTIALAIVFAASARPCDAHLRFGVIAGPQLTQLTQTVDPAGMFTPPRVDWPRTGFGGATAELPLGGHFALVTGLVYGEHADREHWPILALFQGQVQAAGTQRQLRLRTVSLPARVEWRPGQWRLGAGPELRYLVGADERWFLSPPPVGPQKLPVARGRGTGPAAQIFESVSPGQWYDATGQFRRWSLAAQFAAGHELPVGGHALRAEMMWSEGVTHQQWAATAAQRTRAAQLALAWLW